MLPAPMIAALLIVSMFLTRFNTGPAAVILQPHSRMKLIGRRALRTKVGQTSGLPLEFGHFLLDSRPRMT